MNPSVLTASTDSQYRKFNSHTAGNKEEISVITTAPFRAECMSDVLLLHSNNPYANSLLKFFALHSLPKTFRILLTVTLEFGNLDYYQGEM